MFYLDAEFDQTGKKFTVWEMRWLYVQKDRLTQPFENFKISTFTQTALQMPDLPYLCLFNSNKNEKWVLRILYFALEHFSIQLPRCRMGLVSQNRFKIDFVRIPIFGLATCFSLVSANLFLYLFYKSNFLKKISWNKNHFIFKDFHKSIYTYNDLWFLTSW